jgi:dTDP-4-dehydrorhamnose reductase
MIHSKGIVFGKDGQVGKALQNKFKNSTNVIFIGRDQCDISNIDQIIAILNSHQPDIIINAAAYTAVDKAETDQELSHQINALAPECMARYICNIPNGKLIHYSTDYVFDGTQKHPYSEQDKTNPLSKYGKSKLIGELAIQDVFHQHSQTTAKYYLLRTSWVYGDGGNFIKTILRLAKEKDQLKVISDQFGVPTSAGWLAEITLQILSRDIPQGIYHTVPDGETSWHGLATYVIDQSKKQEVSIKFDVKNIQAIPATEYPLPAPRPYNSRMNNKKLKTALQEESFPHWEEQVLEYITKLNVQ